MLFDDKERPLQSSVFRPLAPAMRSGNNSVYSDIVWLVAIVDHFPLLRLAKPFTQIYFCPIHCRIP